MQFQTVILALLQSASIAAAAAVLPAASTNTNANLGSRGCGYPQACFDVCEAARLERNGSDDYPAICGDTAYMNYYKGCVSCMDTYKGNIGCFDGLLYC